MTEILWLDLYLLLLDNNIFVNLMRPGESDYSHVAGHVFDGLTIKPAFCKNRRASREPRSVLGGTRPIPDKPEIATYLAVAVQGTHYPYLTKWKRSDVRAR